MRNDKAFQAAIRLRCTTGAIILSCGTADIQTKPIIAIGLLVYEVSTEKASNKTDYKNLVSFLRRAAVPRILPPPGLHSTIALNRHGRNDEGRNLQAGVFPLLFFYRSIYLKQITGKSSPCNRGNSHSRTKRPRDTSSRQSRLAMPFRPDHHNRRRACRSEEHISRYPGS